MSLCLTLLNEGSTETDVKRAFTSYDVMISPALIKPVGFAAWA